MPKLQLCILGRQTIFKSSIQISKSEVCEIIPPLHLCSTASQNSKVPDLDNHIIAPVLINSWKRTSADQHKYRREFFAGLYSTTVLDMKVYVNVPTIKYDLNISAIFFIKR